MPWEFSRAGGQRGLDATTGRAAPATFTAYIALFTSAPSANALGTEVAFAGYTRQVGTFSAPSAADPPETHITGGLTFGPFTSGTGLGSTPVTHMAIMDDSSGGTAADMMAWSILGASKTPGTGDSLTVAATTGISITATDT